MDDTGGSKGLRAALAQCAETRIQVFTDALAEALEALEPQEMRVVLRAVVRRVYGVEIGEQLPPAELTEEAYNKSVNKRISDGWSKGGN